jgi:hypothetical protein
MADYKIDLRIKLIEDGKRDSKRKRRPNYLVKKLDRTVISLRAKNCTLDPLDTKTT